MSSFRLVNLSSRRLIFSRSVGGLVVLVVLGLLFAPPFLSDDWKLRSFDKWQPVADAMTNSAPVK